MPKLIKLNATGAGWIDDRFTTVADDELVPHGDVIISLTRYLAEGEALASNSREVGVLLAVDPRHALQFLSHAGMSAVLVLGGAEDRFIRTADLRLTALHWSAETHVLDGVPHALMLDSNWRGWSSPARRRSGSSQARYHSRRQEASS